MSIYNPSFSDEIRMALYSMVARDGTGNDGEIDDAVMWLMDCAQEDGGQQKPAAVSMIVRELLAQAALTKRTADTIGGRAMNGNTTPTINVPSISITASAATTKRKGKRSGASNASSNVSANQRRTGTATALGKKGTSAKSSVPSSLSRTATAAAAAAKTGKQQHQQKQKRKQKEAPSYYFNSSIHVGSDSSTVWKCSPLGRGAADMARPISCLPEAAVSGG